MGPADLSIRQLTNEDPDFYPLLGPFLSRRRIVADLGSPVWDDDDKSWFVALTEDGTVAGFAAARGSGNLVELQSAWVAPAHRNRAVYRRLLEARIRAYPGRTLRTMASDGSVTTLVRHGFEVTGRRGRYTRMVRDA